jgi:transcriptional regulator with XRE-family HTH domain
VPRKPSKSRTLDEALGTRLRKLRHQRGLSQRDLARRAGVTDVTVSNIERGRVDPSVSSLKKILAAFSLSLGDFFGSASRYPDRTVYRQHELLEIGEGGISFLQVGHDLRNRALQILHESYPPSADSGEVISHQGEEGGIVIKGHIELTVGNEVHVLGPGDAYYFESSLPHRMRNISPTEPCEIVSACAPPSF